MDPIDRQAAIDVLNVGAEFLRLALDDTDVVGSEREKFEWGLGLVESYISDMKDLPSAQPEPQWIPVFKAKDEDSDQWVTGFYFAYPETTYCFTEDYERHPVKIIHCITFHRMTDWCLPNRPTVCNIDISTLELVGWVDSRRKTFGNEPWILPEPWRGEEP